MNTLQVQDFSLGWTPSDDEIRGRKGGAIRFDNLCLDSEGAIQLCRAFNIVPGGASLSGAVNTIYSRQNGSEKLRYVGLSDGNIQRINGPSIGNGGAAATIRVAFDSGFDFNYIVGGSLKKKDSGSNIFNIGIQKPATPVTAKAGTIPTKAMTSSYAVTLIEGQNLTVGGGGFVADTDPNSNTIQARLIGSTIDSMDFGNGYFGAEGDIIKFDLYLPDTSQLDYVQLIVALNPIGEFLSPSGSGDPGLTDYYSYQWDPGNIEQAVQFTPQTVPNISSRSRTGTLMRQSASEWVTLGAHRSDFIRVGTNNDFSWRTVKGFQVIIAFKAPETKVTFANFNETGSTQGTLDGTYEYFQVNIADFGTYRGKSPASPPMKIPVEVHNGFITLTPVAITDPQVNKVWFYRRKIGGVGSDPSGLPDFVKELDLNLAATTDDLVSDIDILTLQTQENLFNFFRINPQDPAFDNDVYYIVVNYFGRTLYMSPRNIWVSEYLDPDAIAADKTIKLSGNQFERNLWMIRAGPSLLFVGTSKDIYELAGDFTDLPDGTINVTINPLGVKNAPQFDTVCYYSDTLFYVAGDGIRQLSGYSSQNLNGNTDLLWRGFSRYGFPSMAFITGANADYDLAVANNRLFIQVTLNLGSFPNLARRLLVYDFVRKYWYPYFTDPAALFTEEDGTLLAGYADGGDFSLRQLDVGYLIDGSQKQQFLYRSPVFDDNLPNNRKDAYIFKCKVDTGGDDVDLFLYAYDDENDDPVARLSMGTLNTNGLREAFIDLYGNNNFILAGKPILFKRFQLEVQPHDLTTNGGVSFFRLTEWSLEYDPRPKQTTHLRIPQQQLGTAGRKRIPAFNIVIDTLGHNVNFQPIVDGVAVGEVKIINTSDNLVYPYEFDTEVLGSNVGGILSGNYKFEFYQLEPSRITELLPDPALVLRIPYDNLGTTCRKRIFRIAFIIDTKGKNVLYTPILDGTNKPTQIYNTSRKATVFYYFTDEEIAVDIGGLLNGDEDVVANGGDFEYYGIDYAKCISEEMPPRAKYLVLPNNNFGTPAPKRVRTLPFVINTFGVNVQFQPIVDEVSVGTPTIFNTPEKLTVFHYFTTDVFGIDYKGILSLVDMTGPAFESYGMEKPVDVEVIPVSKEFDQVGPIEFFRLGKVQRMRLRLIPLGTIIYYTIYDSDNNTLTGNFAVAANKDDIYEVIFPKGINTDVLRVEYSSPSPFYRFYARFLVAFEGKDTENIWVPKE